MLLAHLVPGYFAAELSKPYWNPDWSPRRRVVLWGTALASTALPDLDVVYNALFRGFINHSTLWTHSIFVYGALGAIWLTLVLAGRWAYLRLVIGLIALGGLSHLVLDVLSHGTPLLYPVSMLFVGMAPRRVIVGGFWAYITDPIFLLEPLLIALAIAYFIWHLNAARSLRVAGLGAITVSWLAFSILFLESLPALQAFALPKIVP